MAAELQPPEEAHIATTTTDTHAVETTTTTVTTTATNSAVNVTENPGPPPITPKRQRRPSVRLGEIGDQAAALSCDFHRLKYQSWRPLKEPTSSKSVKARSLTNLVNGNDIEGLEVEGNQNGEVGIEFGQRRKAKRGPTKRARSSWASKVETLEEEVIREDKEEEGEERVFREFDPDPDPGLDTLLRGQESPFRSSDDRPTGFDTWRTGACGTRRGSGERVRSWLFELGLSRYAPVFEVHEVDEEVLPWLTLEDLKDMGINAVGSRRKLYSAIQKLRKGYS